MSAFGLRGDMSCLRKVKIMMLKKLSRMSMCKYSVMGARHWLGGNLGVATPLVHMQSIMWVAQLGKNSSVRFHLIQIFLFFYFIKMTL